MSATPMTGRRPEALLQVDGLSVGYGLVPVVQQATLQVGRGEAVARLAVIIAAS